MQQNVTIRCRRKSLVNDFSKILVIFQIVGGVPTKETEWDISVGWEGPASDGGLRVRTDRPRPSTGRAQRPSTQEHDPHRNQTGETIPDFVYRINLDLDYKDKDNV